MPGLKRGHSDPRGWGGLCWRSLSGWRCGIALLGGAGDRSSGIIDVNKHYD